MSDKCRDHPTADVVEDSRAGDIICMECGMVTGDRVINVAAEWRMLSDTDGERANPSRVGAAEEPWNTEGALETRIGAAPPTKGEWSGVAFIRRNNNRAEKTISEVFSLMGKVAENLHMSGGELLQAKTLLHKFNKLSQSRGVNKKAIGIAMLYEVAKSTGIIMDKFVEASDLSEKDLRRAVTRVEKDMKSELAYISQEQDEHSLSRYCQELKLPRMVVREAEKLRENIALNCTGSSLQYTAVAIFRAGVAALPARSSKIVREWMKQVSSVTREKMHAIDKLNNEFMRIN